MILETIVGLKTLLLALLCGLTISYIAVLKYSLNTRVYESLICLAQNQTRQSCERELLLSLQPLLFLGQMHRVHLYTQGRWLRAQAEWRLEIPFLQRPLHLHERQSLKLPLPVEGER